jgi:hypothetical protein
MGLRAGFIRLCLPALIFTLVPAVKVQVCLGEFAKRDIQRNAKRTLRVLDPSPMVRDDN